MRDHFYLAAASALFAAVVMASCSGGGPKPPQAKNSNVDQLIADLKSGDSQKVEDAEADLAALGPKSAPAVQPLIDKMKDSDPIVRRLAAYALGQLGSQAKPAVDVLKAGMKDPDRDVVTACINALRDIQPSDVQGIKIYNVTGSAGGGNP